MKAQNITSVSLPLFPEPTIRRLPWYLSYVRTLQEQGVEYVSSTQISRDINVDASMIAKDLSYLNIKGKTRIGYHVATLEFQLQEFLGFKQMHNAVMIGTGQLGSLLLQDNGLRDYGLRIVAGFDVDPTKVGTTIGDVPIYSMDDFATLLPELQAEIGVITVPPECAQHVTDIIVDAGIHALWNFTPFRIIAPEGIVIQNTSIYAHLALIYNRLEMRDVNNLS